MDLTTNCSVDSVLGAIKNIAGKSRSSIFIDFIDFALNFNKKATVLILKWDKYTK